MVNNPRSFTLLFSFLFAVQIWAISPENLETLTVARKDGISPGEMKKLFEDVATLENKKVGELVVELQKVDPDYATEIVLDEGFFKLAYILDNGWDLTKLNTRLEDLLVVALRQQHMACINLVLKSGGWKILLEKKNSEILKQAGLEGSSWYAHILKEWEKPESRIAQEQESYEYRVDGMSRRKKAEKAAQESVAMAPAGGAARSVPAFTTVPVPYATNRAMDDRYRSKINSIEGAANFYSYTNAGGISYGIADVTIPRTHKKGQLEDRGIFEFRHNAAKHVILQKITLKNSEEFFSDLGTMFKAREEAFPDQRQAKELFLYVHGFNVDFSYAMRKTAQMMYDMDYPGLSIAFSWPAKAVSVPLPRDFREDVVRAEASVEILELFIRQIMEKYPARKIHIIAHSLGTRVLSNVILNIAKSLNPTQVAEAAKKVFGEVILAAPAIDAQTFVSTWASQITPLCERVSIYASDDDYALKVQHLAENSNFSFPLGLWEGDKRGLSKGITHYDLSELSSGTFSLDHSVYSEVPMAIDHMKLILNDSPNDGHFGTLAYIKKASFADFFSRNPMELWQFLSL